MMQLKARISNSPEPSGSIAINNSKESFEIIASNILLNETFKT
jgi:hypothetical protein